MSLNNINSLQNYEDLRYVSYLAEQFKDTGELNTDYYIHALANLEQRNEYRYSNGIKFGILNYGSEKIYTVNDLVGSNVTSLILNNDLAFDITVNNVESYLKNSQIYNDGTNFKTLLFCKVLGTDNSSSSMNVEIQYTNIDLSTHMLVEAYRAFHLSDNLYVLLHIYVDEENDGSIKYKLRCYKLRIETNDTLHKLFNYETYLGNSLPEDLISRYNETINPVNCTEQDGLFDSLKSMSIYNQETIENNYSLDCTYDTVDEQYIKISDESLLSKSYHNINDMLYFNYYKIDNYITSINNDLTVSYPNLLKYYSNRQFNSNDEILKDMLGKALFSSIYNELLNSDEFDENDLKNCKLIIPAGTQITYVSNVENSLMIHYTNDIYVFFINDNPTNKELHTQDTSIRFEYPGIDKTILYNVISKYNTKYSDLIDSFIISKNYTLPYIDDSHLWNINGNQTSIYASGESGGNPNILIVQTYLDRNNNIAGRHLNRTDIQQNLLTYNLKTINVDYKNPATDFESSLKYVFEIPKINSKTLDKLKYATLFAISNIVNMGDDINPIFVNAPQMTTIWTIDESFTDFACILMDDGKPLSVENMFGLESYIYKKFAEYGHNTNIFDDLIALKLPKYPLNGSETNAGKNYFVIERNTDLDKLNSNQYSESAYNSNVVELKVADNLTSTGISYATSSSFVNSEKLLTMWNKNWNNTISPYKVGTEVIFNYESAESSGVTTGEHGSDEWLYQTGTNSENSNTLSTSYVTRPKSIIYDIGIYNSINTTEENVEGYPSEHYIDSSKQIIEVNEYIPKSYLPILKESNVLHQDVNVINRTNIMSFSSDGDNGGKIYYSYIGSSCEDNNKNVVHIGTCSSFAYILSLGSESLAPADTSSREVFMRKTDTLSIDFTYTNINSDITKIDNIISSNDLFTISEHGNAKIIRIELKHIFNNYSGSDNQVITTFENTSNDDVVSFNLNASNISTDATRIVDYVKEIYKDRLSILNVTNLTNVDNKVDNSISAIYIKNENNNLIIFERPLTINIVSINNNGQTTNTVYIL